VPEPTATVAGQSIALHLTGYPDIPNRWGAGHIRATSIRLDYGNNRTPDGRHAFVTGVWVRENGEATTDPIDRYYDASDGDMSAWPDWLALLARLNAPTATKPLSTRAESHEAAVERVREAAQGLYAHVGIRVLAALDEEAPLTPCTCRQAVHAREHTGRTIDDCPWCTPAPDIRPNRAAGRAVTTVDARLLRTNPET
jgi:hypothetical protein